MSVQIVTHSLPVNSAFLTLPDVWSASAGDSICRKKSKPLRNEVTGIKAVIQSLYPCLFVLLHFLMVHKREIPIEWASKNYTFPNCRYRGRASQRSKRDSQCYNLYCPKKARGMAGTATNWH